MSRGTNPADADLAALVGIVGILVGIAMSVATAPVPGSRPPT
ncbi:hypothetical protein [Streptosporangium sp. NPDC000509]